MAKFRFTKDLTSYEVGIDLIKNIEEYLCSEAPKILGLDSDIIKSGYQIKLSDNFGTETISSIDLYKHPIFPNDISEVQINLQIIKPKYLNLLLSFDEGWKRCRVAIELESERPRDSVVNLWAGLEKILSFKKTNHQLFYGKHNMSLLAVLVAVVLLVAIAMYIDNSPRRLNISLILFFFIIFWYTIGASLHPYTNFDTQKNRSKKALSKWFFTGIAGAIVLDMAYLLLKKLLDNF